MEQKTQVAVAMSGGVDSSVAAFLLQQAGYACHGATMALTPAAAGQAAAQNAAAGEADAARIAALLGIPFSVFDLRATFDEEVVRPFAKTYLAGQTPNPCILCNRRLKFGAFLQKANALGCAAIATGHYVRAGQGAQSGRHFLQKAADLRKDQSYVLYTLTQKQLAACLFPLGDMQKEEAQAIAQRQGLFSAPKAESQDICFVPDGDYAAFLERYLGRSFPPGDFVDETGGKLGRHRGLVHYTVGQRRGIGISAPQPLYVQSLCPANNTVRLGENAALFARHLYANQLNWVAVSGLPKAARVKAKIRYRHTEQWATAEQTGEDSLRVTFEEAQRAITPGQSVVLYDGDIVLGGGVICGSAP